jgi:hypothetical protein
MGWTGRVLAAAALLIACLVPASAQAPKRLALVIGNGAYQVAAWRLDNPPRDAALIAGKLRGLGFEVDAVTNASRATMDAAFERFGARLKAAGPDAVAFFYFAGHGAQRDGVNFLVPVDANAATSDRLRYQSPSMQFLLDDMAEAGNAVNIIVLDACRDMPLPDGSRSIGRGGLADLGRVANVFIAFATAPGRTAADGGGANSPFTTQLAAALDAQAAEPLSLLFDDINARVYRATGGGQSPEYRNGLVRAPRWSLAASVRVAAPDPEIERLRKENEALRQASRPAPVPVLPRSASATPNVGKGAPRTITGEDIAARHETVAPASPRNAWDEVKRTWPISRDAALNARLARVGQRIAAASGVQGQPWEFVVFDTAEVNAAALTGGKVAFHKGLMDIAATDDYIAAVMAHEIAHLIAAHQPVVTPRGGTRVNVRYSAAQEEAADRLGADIMYRAGYDVREAVRFWESLARADGRSMVSEHPNPEARMRTLRTYIETRGYARF